MKFSQIITQVNNFLGRTTSSPGLWSDDEIKDAVNSSLDDAVADIEEAYEYYFLSWAVISEVSGESIYSLPDDCNRVVELSRQSSSSTDKPYFLSKIGWATQEQEFYQWVNSVLISSYGFVAEAYQQMGNKIRLINASQAGNLGTLIIVFTRDVPHIIDNDETPAIPSRDHGFLVWRALQYLLPKEEEGGPRMDMVNRLADEKRIRMIASIRSKNVQAPKHINFIDSGGI